MLKEYSNSHKVSLWLQQLIQVCNLRISQNRWSAIFEQDFFDFGISGIGGGDILFPEEKMNKISEVAVLPNVVFPKFPIFSSRK